jgi:hypothetical protein
MTFEFRRTYRFEQTAGVHALVLELVEGPTRSRPPTSEGSCIAISNRRTSR